MSPTTTTTTTTASSVQLRYLGFLPETNLPVSSDSEIQLKYHLWRSSLSHASSRREQRDITMATQPFPQSNANEPLEELEKHHPHKSKKKMKSLKDLLPSRGFEFIEREPIFADNRSNAATKEAITAELPVLSRPEVDVVIAELFVKAKKAKDESRTSTLAGENFKKAAEDTEWCAQLPGGTISRLMMYMMQARDLHIKFSEYRKNTVDPSTEGMTARAIDLFTGKSPAAEPDDAFKDMDPEMIANRKYYLFLR
ncbi:hypothetical protein AB5N19_09570 [Seiridium cardinale]